ncbi:Uncaracterized surface protein containing fasciclin (FAS1) repeats [Chitinophaga eiseniae]|uniref:Uncaracterized surface protein containing fasciclin (FAS1) repeats n=1 Tax=Chitinophaga eiseniae TaxID=634771 RepID=A0A1T4M6U1_9BACT|nr:fasciclin domain-containing protein [Chitinophaga eiseniae]SJZ62444.1 Uncaracterized surface protein containing fasciclin (FAS1) repeats [Chitinophaga eiseniae]
MKRIFYTGLTLLLMTACSKDEKTTPDQQLSNRITYVIADNLFNFSSFNTVIERTGYGPKLAGEGPLTVLVPDNNAFIKAGYANASIVLQERASVLNNIMTYHVLSGTWELNKLPFAFNQELTTAAGAKMYATRWVKGQDTVLTINGTPVVSYNLPASNGLIQVMSEVLQPLVNQTLSDAIAADTTLTFLNVALQQAGMKDMMSSKNSYTFFAPSNSAFRSKGFPSADSVGRTDPAVLKRMLDYTFFTGRRFIYDYVLTTDATDRSQQAMYNGNNITIQLLKEGVKYTGVNIQGSGNTGPVTILKSNVLTGNGVLHIINSVLSENQ